MINKSYISRQSLIDACNAYSESPWANDYGGYSKGVRDALRAIKDCAQVKSEDATIGIGLPYADVVEVVRCRECENWTKQTDNPGHDGLGACSFHSDNLVTGEGFCYWGQRREDGAVEGGYEMPRLIDADALAKKAYEVAYPVIHGWNDHERGLTLTGIAQLLDEAPTVDAVPVVRCGQCRFTKTDGTDDPAIYCEKWDRWEMPPDFYCSYGERKDGADNVRSD